MADKAMADKAMADKAMADKGRGALPAQGEAAGDGAGEAAETDRHGVPDAVKGRAVIVTDQRVDQRRSPAGEQTGGQPANPGRVTAPRLARKADRRA